LNGDASLSGSGNSVAKILGGADGELKMLINDGAISKGLTEIAGLNVGNYLVTKLFGDDEVKINCAAADFGLQKGLMTSRLFVFDTENALVNVDGTVNFANEKLDLDVTPHSKGLRIFSLRSPLYVRGTFAKPDAGVHAGPLVARGAGMIALGVTVGPAASLLALVAPSKSDDNQCTALLQRMRLPAKVPAGKR
ncbi:AsmA family protein, partial [Pseudomonas aeruginosa]